MAKKQKGKPERGKNPAKTTPANAKGDQGDPDAEKGGKSFDFGGLPDRDLKKNLGCG